MVFRITALLPPDRRTEALFGRAEQLVDLSDDVDPERDHVRGPEDATVTARRVRRLPVPLLRPGRARGPCRRSARATSASCGATSRCSDVHPQAELAAQASEAAAEQGKFWEMHDLLLDRQDHLMKPDLLAYAEELGLDVPRFGKELYKHVHAGRVGQDVESADISGVSGTPTFFVNGRRHYGAFDVASLTQAIATARDRARIGAS